MAKTRALTRFQPRPIIVNVPRRRGRVRRAAGRAVHYARRGARHAKGHLPAIGLGAASFAAGWAEANGYLDMIPKIGGKKALGVGIVGYAATRLTSNRYIRLGGLALLMAAAYDFGKSQGGGTSGWGDDASGGGRGSGMSY